MTAAFPLGDGWWRGPKPASSVAPSELGPWVELADSSAAFQPTREFLIESASHGAGASADCASTLAVSRAIHAYAQSPRPAEWMAVLNLTPDSFSDGGKLEETQDLLRAAKTAQVDGAAWLDLGAESTRPGAVEIESEVQLARLLPAIEALLPLGIPLSIDTRSAKVAEACLQTGATMINDVSGLGHPEMAAVCADHDAWLTLMHMRGTPETMREQCTYRFLLGEVADEWKQSADRALAAGIRAERLLLDPGIGFAKTAEQSRELLARVGALRALGHSLLVGPSRKSFQADLIPERTPADRDCGTAGAASSCIMQGVTTLRLHSGRYWDAARVAAGIAAALPECGLPPELRGN